MSDLWTAETVSQLAYCGQYDAVANAHNTVVAAKDAEIARLQATIATLVEALRAENERLVEALEKMLGVDAYSNRDHLDCCEARSLARAALASVKEGK